MDTNVNSDITLMVRLIRWKKKLLYDHQIYHDIDYLQVCIVNKTRVDNNNEQQLEELLNRKECKLIWKLGSITPYGLIHDDAFCCYNKRCENR